MHVSRDHIGDKTLVALRSRDHSRDRLSDARMTIQRGFYLLEFNSVAP